MADRGGIQTRPAAVEAASRPVLVQFGFQTLVMMGYAVQARDRMNVDPILYAYAGYGAICVALWWRRKRATPRPDTVQH